MSSEAASPDESEVGPPTATDGGTTGRTTEFLTSARSRWGFLLGGVVSVGAAAWAFATGWVGLTGSHPIGWITTAATAVVGLTLVVRAATAGPRPPRPRWRRWSSHLAVGLATVVLVGTVVYTRPLSADGVALDAVADGAGVEVSDGPTSLTMHPAAPRQTGLVFYPGAKVDPRAYARVLRPVAEAGFTVVVAKQPYNLAVLDADAAGRWIGDADDGIDRWVVGGHSLGGAMAATFASDERPELAGLLLYAAYPAGDLAARELAVTSVSGTRDGLATPADIAASVTDLPPTTSFVAIDGAIHAYFGDYGTQRGDGEPTIDRETAQDEIIAATLALLERVDDER